jgi:hypothetical protein
MSALESLGPALAAAACIPNLVACLTVLAAAALTTGGVARRRSGLALGLTALFPAWWVSADHPIVRAGSVLVMTVANMRLFDLRSGEWPLGDRVVHVLSVVDTRRLRPVPRRLDGPSLRGGLTWLVFEVLGYLALQGLPAPSGALSWLARWGCALVVVYAGVSAVYALLRAQYGTLGLESGVLHRAPLLSVTVGELWGERWARPISAWMRDNCFRPLARRRRARSGALLAFSFSAGFHAYAIWVALGLVRGAWMALMMFAFFVTQAIAILLEQRLRARAWPRALGHAWTVAWMLGSSPLFLEPAARILVQ